mmetsp:Transcript_34090/g.72627  ORF Transcript_34090/g.72627 Transcript_34090/m.72627 type:complete len:232 (+) Transcript_34090:178-873(+)
MAASARLISTRASGTRRAGTTSSTRACTADGPSGAGQVSLSPASGTSPVASLTGPTPTRCGTTAPPPVSSGLPRGGRLTPWGRACGARGTGWTRVSTARRVDSAAAARGGAALSATCSARAPAAGRWRASTPAFERTGPGTRDSRGVAARGAASETAGAIAAATCSTTASAGGGWRRSWLASSPAGGTGGWGAGTASMAALVARSSSTRAPAATGPASRRNLCGSWCTASL